MPHEFHHSLHVNNFAVVTFEDLSPRTVRITKKCTKLLVTRHGATNVVNVRKIPERKNKQSKANFILSKYFTLCFHLHVHPFDYRIRQDNFI